MVPLTSFNNFYFINQNCMDFIISPCDLINYFDSTNDIN